MDSPNRNVPKMYLPKTAWGTRLSFPKFSTVFSTARDRPPNRYLPAVFRPLLYPGFLTRILGGRSRPRKSPKGIHRESRGQRPRKPRHPPPHADPAGVAPISSAQLVRSRHAGSVRIHTLFRGRCPRLDRFHRWCIGVFGKPRRGD